MGSNVIVVEVDPLRALQAVMDGFMVMTMMEAAKEGDIFVTVTGNKNVIRKEHIELMKDGAILANSGHFNVEVSISDLLELSKKRRTLRPNTEEFELKNGNKIYLLAEGRLVNLASAEGHPSEVMDMSFSDQALTCKYIVENHKNMEPKVYDMPSEIGNRVAKLKLDSMKIKIDELTKEQKKYLSSWAEGT
jgi:adenosylhomocysteinase